VASQGSGAAVRAELLSVRHRRTLALDSLDLSLGPGVHALLGPNRAGKTSLLRVLATAAAPSEGRVQLLGRDPRIPAQRLEIRRRLGYLPQEFGVFRGFTLREFLGYAAWLKEMPGARIPAATERAAERVGLADRLDHKLRTLSGGMKQRTGIAQAIINDPRLLLLDEPTTGLDSARRTALHRLLREIGRAACVVVSTHLMEDVLGACDDALVLVAGHDVFRGSVADLEAAGGYDALLSRR
jgi:ABC-type multidrug transport system ATPase subunit